MAEKCEDSYLTKGTKALTTSHHYPYFSPAPVHFTLRERRNYRGKEAKVASAWQNEEERAKGVQDLVKSPSVTAKERLQLRVIKCG